MGFLSSLLRGKATAAEPEWSVRMGWRYVTYAGKKGSLSFQIEPMAKGPDLVYVPDERAWRETAPAWARSRASEILERLRSAGWNRDLVWREVGGTRFLASDGPIAGSLESSAGGQKLELLRMFDSDGSLTHAQCHEVWHRACERFASAASGTVTIFAASVVPESVFELVELPALRANPNVTLVFK